MTHVNQTLGNCGRKRDDDDAAARNRGRRSVSTRQRILLLAVLPVLALSRGCGELTKRGINTVQTGGGVACAPEARQHCDNSRVRQTSRPVLFLDGIRRSPIAAPAMRDGGMTSRQIGDVAVQLCSALSAAHRRGGHPPQT